MSILPPPSRRYRVERDVWGAGRVEVSLVGESRHRGLRHREADESGRVVMFRRAFAPRAELEALERYAGQLEIVAAHANDGTFGCFIDTRSRDGSVEVTLYERWFDGEQVRCERLAERSFDAMAEGAVVAGAEFVAELEDWAERRNDEREAQYAEAAITSTEAAARSAERRAAGDELASILHRHGASGE